MSKNSSTKSNIIPHPHKACLLDFGGTLTPPVPDAAGWMKDYREFGAMFAG